MKTLPLNLDLDGIVLDEKSKTLSPKQILLNVIENVVLEFGFNKSDRRKAYNFLNLIEAAVNEDKESIDLEDDHWGMIKKAFEDSKLKGGRLLRAIDILMDQVKDR